MVSVGMLRYASRFSSIRANWFWQFFCVMVSASGLANDAAAEVKVTDFGKTADGEDVKAFTITNSKASSSS